MGPTHADLDALRAPTAGRAAPGSTRSWPHFDQGTQRAILRLYRSSPPDRLASRGPATALRTSRPGAGRLGRARSLPPGRASPTAYAQALGDARLEHLSDAGHWPWHERPDVIDRVAAFLAG